MISFTTSSGSVYELDSAAKKVRRVSGQSSPSWKQPADGEWMDYITLLKAPEVGARVLIHCDGPDERPVCLLTSSVISVS